MKISPLAFNINQIKIKTINYKTNPLPFDSVSFGALKKSNFQGIDLAVINQFKAPIQTFNNNEDFQAWCLNKINENYPSDKEYGAKDEFATNQRKKLIEEWKKYILEENEAYTNAICLMILSSITKNLKENNDALPPVLNKGVLAQTIDEIQEKLKKDKNYQFNFNKLYLNNLQLFYTSNNSQEPQNSYTGWVIIPSYENDKENFEANVEKLKTLSHSGWCTKTFNAEPYLKVGDFHIYLEEGKPKVGVRFKYSRIVEIQGEKNNGNIPLKYYSEIKEHVENYKISTKMETELNVAKVGAKKLEKFINSLDKPINEYSSKELLEFAGIEVEQDEDGLLIISEFHDISPVFSFDDLGINENALFKDIKEIKGKADFSRSKAKSLGSIRKIGGNATFINSSVEDLGELREIGGSIGLFCSRVKSLKNLETIGKDAYLDSPDLADIGNLRVIKGNASFHNASIQSLNNLEIIGKNAEFSLGRIRDLGKLRFIGGNLALSLYNQFRADNLEFVGGDAIFDTEKIYNLPTNLMAIGGKLKLSNSSITSLNPIRAVGGDIDAHSSNLKDLGALEYLGGKFMIDYDKKYDKAQIQKAQSNPDKAKIIEEYKQTLIEALN